jgi:hypothetical protein
MLYALLIQTPVTHTSTVELTDLTNVYLTLGGTIVASLFATLASLNAARTANKAAVLSSETTQKVADLSRQTTREVADLSAQVTRESAGLAANTARELKEQDYKYDFYKKIIDRRFKAWEEINQFYALLLNSYLEEPKSGLKYPYYFSSKELFSKVLEKANSMIDIILWIGPEYAVKFGEFSTALSAIQKECIIDDESNQEDEHSLAVLDNKLLVQAGIKHMKEIDAMTSELLNISNAQIRLIPDVENFLTGLSTLIVAQE